MKRNQITLVCALALALAGITSLRAVEEGHKEGKATIRTIHGTVQWLDNNIWLPVKPNMKFPPGVTIRTGADGQADISVNGTASALRLTNNTTVQIPAMSYIGSAREGDTTTMLNLMSGAILGNVKKISANSRYEIMTPHGVAGIRGTDFRVEAIPTLDGMFKVKFDSVTGVITVSAVVNGVVQTRTLTTGTSWEIGENVKEMKAELLEVYQSEILNMVESIETSINGPPGGGGRGPGPGPGNGGGPVSPFPGGAPPQGGSSSG